MHKYCKDKISTNKHKQQKECPENRNGVRTAQNVVNAQQSSQLFKKHQLSVSDEMKDEILTVLQSATASLTDLDQVKALL